MGLGRVEPQNEHEPFCMTVLALKLSRRANAVSSLHGHVSRAMWAHLWPWRARRGNPHRPHHQRRARAHLAGAADAPALRPALSAPTGMQRMRRARGLAGHRQRRSAASCGKRTRRSRTCCSSSCAAASAGRPPPRRDRRTSIEAARSVLDPDALTIGFARRFATYKRADLILQRHRARSPSWSTTRSGRCSSSSPARPIPPTSRASSCIQKIANLRHDPRFAGRIVFVEDYDINVGRHLVQGVDVWLNNPRRPLEASGTSGQKAVLNGGLNCRCSTAGGPRPTTARTASPSARGETHVDDRHQRRARRRGPATRAATSEVIPLYYDRDADGLPRGWIERMKRSIRTLAWRFSAHRMVMDYVQKSLPPGRRRHEQRHPRDVV